MLGSLTSLTGGGGMTGGAATNGDFGAEASFYTGDAGNIRNEGITINKGFKFDDKNPVHVGGAIILAVALMGFLVKTLRS